MEAFLTIAVIISFLYACLWVGLVAYDWKTGWKLSREAQTTDEAGD